MKNISYEDIKNPERYLASNHMTEEVLKKHFHVLLKKLISYGKMFMAILLHMRARIMFTLMEALCRMLKNQTHIGKTWGGFQCHI